ncbi:MAG TPA: hydrogenase subunit MbhD domain-containing protein [Gaiellaceae bacterium]|nr:hydrogenase subunit MbhD domain-containing protein [Gaiellaceae bacterium]
MILASLHPLQYAIFGLVALAATTVVLTRDVQRQIVVNGVYGILLVILFVVLAAPDVALSMLVVSSVGYPLVVLIAIAKSRDR